MNSLRKKLYITIDDGPTSHTKKKLDFLEKHQIPAIWFCRGEGMAKYPDVIVDAIRRGFWIGNHSYDHPHFSEISFQKACEQILRTEEHIEALYKKAAVKRPNKLFRFPFLDKGEKHHLALQDFLKEEGFQIAHFPGIQYQYYTQRKWDREIDVPWTYDCCEYALFAPEYMKKFNLFTTEDFLQRLEREDAEKGFGLNSPSADIILFHDFEETHHLFEPLLQAILAKKPHFLLPKIG